ncbi:response regulator receiver modulated serine phosphatase [Solidesulfovibrio fructosivorans JJ]]|uniref:Response regulator receiver modulated serine phosphatase n=1 Tax=Solidesulfovibrio fructosivorans JJ] TaxID=596151 RepID=E1K1K3_SOLFR|nr:fused response regulator/phosphatase [Solidesulfovibrio fructosivorans]EFL49497.1 response regulator receiver modulated serine phosphatase [Solidesulfovibrio fructosivorans JJ]]
MEHPTSGSEGDKSRPPRVLIVDDEAINLETLAWMLREAGFEPLRADCGRIGREIAARDQPDLIILDIVMPGESGFETCGKLTADPATADIPIIFISGLDDVDNKVKGLRMGAVDYVPKPFAREEVLARVKVHIRLRRGMRALLAQQAAKLAQIRDAQQAILACPADLPEARFAVRYEPALEAGGDFYDVFPWTGTVMGYFMADISGHDLGASFVTSSLKALLRQNTGPLFTPVETLKNINSVLASLLRDGKHLTAALVCLNRARRKLTLVNGGHPPPILVEAESARTSLLAADGDVLGVFASVQFGRIERPVAPGDRLYLYTDGLIERFGPGGKAREQGLAELLAACASVAGRPLEEAVDAVMRGVLDAGRPADDMVLMGIEV